MKKKKIKNKGIRKLPRPIYLIEKDLKDANNEGITHLRKGDYAKYQQVLQRISVLKDELEEAHEDVKFMQDNQSMDKAERSFFSKLLALSLNEADLAVYHDDIFLAYMRTRGMVPVAEWEQKRRALRKAIAEYRNFVNRFFYTNELKNSTMENMSILMDTIKEKVFTDREIVYYNMYEERA